MPGIEAVAAEIDMLGEEALEPRSRQAGSFAASARQDRPDSQLRRVVGAEDPGARAVEDMAADG